MAAWTHIAHSALSLPAATVTWTGISGSYDHLCIKASARHDYSGYYYWVQMQFNNDTGSNYTYTRLEASTATAASARNTGTTSWWSQITADSATADTFGNVEIWIPNYANTANFKQVLSTACAENASTTDSQWRLTQYATLWSDTSAITEIDFIANSGNFMAYSTFDLYGVTGA